MSFAWKCTAYALVFMTSSFCKQFDRDEIKTLKNLDNAYGDVLSSIEGENVRVTNKDILTGVMDVHKNVNRLGNVRQKLKLSKSYVKSTTRRLTRCTTEEPITLDSTFTQQSDENNISNNEVTQPDSGNAKEALHGRSKEYIPPVKVEDPDHFVDDA